MKKSFIFLLLAFILLPEASLAEVSYWKLNDYSPVHYAEAVSMCTAHGTGWVVPTKEDLQTHWAMWDFSTEIPPFVWSSTATETGHWAVYSDGTETYDMLDTMEGTPVTCINAGTTTEPPTATTTIPLDLEAYFGISSPLLSSLGSLNFGIAIVITILSIMLIGFMFNHLNSKKPWR